MKLYNFSKLYDLLLSNLYGKVVMFFFLASNLISNDNINIKISGLFENAVTYNSVKDNSILNQNNRIINIDDKLYEGGLQFRPKLTIGDFTLSSEIWSVIKVNQDWKVKDDIIISEVFCKYPIFDNVVLIGGRKNLNWGAGYYWNPSSPFTDRERNNTDKVPFYKEKGNNFIQANFGFNQFAIDLYATYKKDENLILKENEDEIDAFLLFNIFFPIGDLTVNSGYIDKSYFLGLSTSMTIGDYLETHAEVAYQYKKNKTLPYKSYLFENAQNEYQIYEFEKKTEYNNFDLLVGAQITLPINLNIVLEYIHNHIGYTNNDLRLLYEGAEHSNKYLQSAVGEAHRGFLANSNYLPGFLARNYAFSRITLEDLFLKSSISALFRLNIDNTSDFLFAGNFKIPFKDIFEWNLYAEYFSDRGKTESNLFPFKYDISSSIIIYF